MIIFAKTIFAPKMRPPEALVGTGGPRQDRLEVAKLFMFTAGNQRKRMGIYPNADINVYFYIRILQG